MQISNPTIALQQFTGYGNLNMAVVISWISNSFPYISMVKKDK